MGSSERDEQGRYYKLLAKQATAGDRDSAVELLREFSRPGADPEVIAYVAQCVAGWTAKGCDSEATATAFNLTRAGRPGDPRIQSRRIKAMLVYLLLRGEGKGYSEAIRRAAAVAHLSKSSVRKLADGQGLEFGAALFTINAMRSELGKQLISSSDSE